ncbi:MAG: hypothetical protein HYS81_01085 [Candidatus Aenigmatarchaeota archaeon]|nr:MAG: hypothetical protein HYS81_01085 [Candidatus Aenigmarchaeota archaeon]
MKALSITYAAAIFLIPVAVLTVFFLLPTQQIEMPRPEAHFVNKTADELLLQTHELPKYRSPLNWKTMLKIAVGSDEAPGITDGLTIVYGRRYVDNVTNSVLQIDQVTQKLYVFDSFANAESFYSTLEGDLASGTHDVVFDSLSQTSECRGFYNRTSALDTMVAPCLYGNIVFYNKAVSRDFKSKTYLQTVISVTEGKF